MNPIIPRCEINIRQATIADLPFINKLQDQHYRQIGYFPTKQFEEYIGMGAVLIAEQAHVPHAPLGYCISRDRYLKRDELGVIFQLCVAPGEQRKLVGASLLKAVFERSAYGCRVYCCWCAQDLAANWFWESMGFVPLAFRAGSGKKKRVHIFWQRRINEGDESTPLWYPFQTNSGAIRADRLVFPIPPDVHWKDVQAVALPQEMEDRRSEMGKKKRAALPGPADRRSVASSLRRSVASIHVPVSMSGGIRFAPSTPEPAPAKPAAPRQKKPAERIDPKYLAGARELRDRYLEHVNSQPIVRAGKHDVGRALPDAQPNRPALLQHYAAAA